MTDFNFFLILPENSRVSENKNGGSLREM